MKKILVAVGTNIIEQVDRFPMGILWWGVWGWSVFQVQKASNGSIGGVFHEKREICRRNSLLSKCTQFSSYRADWTLYSFVLSTGTQDSRFLDWLLPYTWCKNLCIWTGISYNTSLNPIVQFCITLYCITFPSCLANEIYFSLLCTSKTYPIYSKQFKRKSYHIEKEFQVRKLVNVHQGIVPVYLYCHENAKNCKQRS